MTGTLTGGTLFIVVKVAGSAVASVSNFTINGNSGTAAVIPVLSARVGAGTFTSTVTVHACLNDQTCATGELSGSPQVINVTYTVGAFIPADAVMPHVVTSGTAGQVVIRGHGLAGVSSVSFGSTPATNVTASDTEVHASYPTTLPTGTLSVSLNGNAIASPGSIVSLAPQSYTAATLSFPEAPQGILATLYDAEHSALLVAASFSPTSNNKLWRYTYSGGTWSAASELAISQLKTITFSNDGSRLIALTSDSLLMLDPAAPALPALSTVAGPPWSQSTLPDSNYLYNIAWANDGNALVASATNGAEGDNPVYIYSPAVLPSPFVAEPGAGLFNWINGSTMLGGGPMLVSSADGSLVLAAQNGVSPPQVYQYDPVTTLFTVTPVVIDQPAGQPPAMDSSASKRVIYDGSTNSVYDSNYTLLGKIPGAVRVLAINRQGTRVYALNHDSTLHTYDLTAATVSGNYPEIGTGSAQTVPASGSNISLRLEIAADGGTLFLAGDTGVAVIPTPH